MLTFAEMDDGTLAGTARYGELPTEKTGRWLILALVILQLVAVYPFRFISEFGERDSYRMFLGIVDTLKSGALFNSSLMYNREASFGYYGFFYILDPVIGHAPERLASMMNWVSTLSVVLFMIPGYMVAERFFGKWIAVAGSIILIGTPVWWHCALYAHPITPAVFLFFSGLAILCQYGDAPSWPVRSVAFACFAAALSFRFDVVLLFPALAAVLWEVRRPPVRNILFEGFFYIVCPVPLIFAAQHLLPAVSQGAAPPSVVGMLARFQSFSHLGASVPTAVIGLTTGFTPILLLAIPLSTWILFRERRYSALLFSSGVIFLNLLFWFPVSLPARHYLMMTPAMGISLAVVLQAIASRLAMPPYFTAIAGAAAAICVAGASLALGHGTGHLSYFPSQFQDQLMMQTNIAQATSAAEGLLRLPPIETPVVILCDSNLAIAEMEKSTSDISVIYKALYAGDVLVTVHEVRLGKNRLVMVEQGWDDAAVEEFDRSGGYPGLPVLVTPYLPIPYKGPRALRQAAD